MLRTSRWFLLNKVNYFVCRCQIICYIYYLLSAIGSVEVLSLENLNQYCGNTACLPGVNNLGRIWSVNHCMNVSTQGQARPFLLNLFKESLTINSKNCLAYWLSLVLVWWVVVFFLLFLACCKYNNLKMFSLT